MNVLYPTRVEIRIGDGTVLFFPGRCGSHGGNGRDTPGIDPELGPDRYQNRP